MSDRKSSDDTLYRGYRITKLGDAYVAFTPDHKRTGIERMTIETVKRMIDRRIGHPSRDRRKHI